MHMAESRRAVPPSAGRPRILGVMLACGIAAPLVYLTADVVAGSRWAGYSFRDQTISELNANGSPVRPITIRFGFVGYLLLATFGIGVWRIALGTCRLKLAGAALIGLGLSAMWALPFASMNVRGTKQGAAGARHLASGVIAIPLLIATMGLAANKFGRVFRLYSIATVAVLLVFGAWAGVRSTGIEEDRPTPWVGIIERVSVYAYQLWIVVFAGALLRCRVVGVWR